MFFAVRLGIFILKNQIDAQFIFSIFLQKPLHVSGLSIAHHQEVHRMNTTIGFYYLLLLLLLLLLLQSIVLAGQRTVI